MQLSSNSNRAIELLIRSKPTYAGQYRQAQLHLKDRKDALQFSFITESKVKAEINLKQTEIEIIQRDIERTEDELGRKYLQHKIDILKAETAQLEFELQDLNIKRADAEREIKATEAELERIKVESEIDFDKLTDSQFQVLMTRDTECMYARRIAIYALSSHLGLSPEACEMIMELPDDDRAKVLMQSAQYLARPEIKALIEAGGK